MSRHKGSVVYHGMIVSSGTILMSVIEADDATLSEKLYKEQKAKFHAQFPKEDWQRIIHNLLNTEDYYKYAK